MTFYLLSEELRHKIPRTGSLGDTAPQDWVVHVRFFDPASTWRWYVIEYDGKDTFFGLVLAGDNALAGPFSLTELENLRCAPGSTGGGVERDSYFQPISLHDLCASEPAIRPLLRELTDETTKPGQTGPLNESLRPCGEP